MKIYFADKGQTNENGLYDLKTVTRKVPTCHIPMMGIVQYVYVLVCYITYHIVDKYRLNGQ